MFWAKSTEQKQQYFGFLNSKKVMLKKEVTEHPNEFVLKIYATILKDGSHEFIWVTEKSLIKTQNLKIEERTVCKYINLTLFEYTLLYVFKKTKSLQIPCGTVLR